jgi:Putative zinc-finger
MDHEVVVRRKIAESYLLGELDSEAREEFEEHYFECAECALDVRAGTLFVEQSKSVLGEKPEAAAAGLRAVEAPVPNSAARKPGWLAWFHPGFAVPALALLLAVIGYQNLVMYPGLQRALNHPHVLPFAAVSIGTWGSGEHVIKTAPEQGFLLLVRIPPDSYATHTAELYNPADKLEWSLTFPSTSSTEDRWPLEVPAAKRESGTYRLVIHGISPTGESKEVGRATFELQIQKQLN